MKASSSGGGRGSPNTWLLNFLILLSITSFCCICNGLFGFFLYILHNWFLWGGIGKKTPIEIVWSFEIRSTRVALVAYHNKNNKIIIEFLFEYSMIFENLCCVGVSPPPLQPFYYKSIRNLWSEILRISVTFPIILINAI